MEYRVLSNVITQIIWIQSLLRELQIQCLSFPNVYCDNISVIHLAVNPILHARTKHVEIDHHFVRARVVTCELRVHHVSSKKQFVDPLTKWLCTLWFQVM